MNSNDSTSLFLIGPMGAGKSTLGRHLAQLLGRPFYDSDRVIEEKTGANIPWIFDMEGEEGFRRREREVIDELTVLPDIVLATGGGSILHEDNRRHLRQRGFVVYLWTPVEVQVARTRHDRNRPLLRTGNPKARLGELLEGRDPLYRETAHVVISTAAGNLKKVTEQVLGCLSEHASR